MTDKTSIIILGARTPTGAYLMGHLAAANLAATVISRRAVDVPDGFTAVAVDLNDDKCEWQAPAGSVIVSLLPLWVLIGFLPRLTTAKAIIATGSTSRFSKTTSSAPHEREIAEKLATAEEALQKWTEQRSITWTILRPTLIYDCKTDMNVTRMARFVRHWHFLPIAHPANGLRQPIHAEDVAKAAFKSLNNPAASNKAFNISGSEILTYRAMAARIFTALGQRPRFVCLPVSMIEAAFAVAATFGITKGQSAAMFQRMNEDLIFETAEGLAALDYEPQSFEPDFSGLEE